MSGAVVVTTRKFKTNPLLSRRQVGHPAKEKEKDGSQ
jgi:hypothetical protein